MKPTLLILAAGMGSRYGGLKQMESLGVSGETIMDFSIYDAIRAGFGKIVFVIRHDIEDDFKRQIGSKYEKIIKVEYAYQELDCLPKGYKIPEGRKKPWGTGHAILVAKNLINEPFVVINADDFYGSSGYALLAEYIANSKNNDDNKYAMIGFVLNNTLSDNGFVSRGVCNSDKNDLLIDVVERVHIEKIDNSIFFTSNGTKEELTGNEIVSMNMFGAKPEIFKLLEKSFTNFLDKLQDSLTSEFFLPSFIDELTKKEIISVQVLISQDSWLGITYPNDKPLVVEKIKKLVDEKIYPNKLFS